MCYCKGCPRQDTDLLRTKMCSEGGGGQRGLKTAVLTKSGSLRPSSSQEEDIDSCLPPKSSLMAGSP